MHLAVVIHDEPFYLAVLGHEHVPIPSLIAIHGDTQGIVGGHRIHRQLHTGLLQGFHIEMRLGVCPRQGHHRLYRGHVHNAAQVCQISEHGYILSYLHTQHGRILVYACFLTVGIEFPVYLLGFCQGLLYPGACGLDELLGLGLGIVTSSVPCASARQVQFDLDLIARVDVIWELSAICCPMVIDLASPVLQENTGTASLLECKSIVRLGTFGPHQELRVVLLEERTLLWENLRLTETAHSALLRT